MRRVACSLFVVGMILLAASAAPLWGETGGSAQISGLVSDPSGAIHLDAGSNGEYEGLLLKVQHRFSNHYTILGNYTWSHCISETDFQGDMGGPYTQNPFNRNADCGNCSFDLRQIFNLTFIAQTPKFSNPWANSLGQLAAIAGRRRSHGNLVLCSGRV